VAGAVFVTLALASFSADPAIPEVVGDNWVGPVGAAVARALVQLVGVLAWSVPVELVLISLPLFRDRPTMASLARMGGDFIVIVVLASLAHVSLPLSTAFGAMAVGGAIGELFGELMRSLFSTVGSYLVGTTTVGLVLIARASFSFISFARRAGETTETAAKRGVSGVKALSNAWSKARAIERRRANVPDTDIPISSAGADDAIIATIDDDVVQASREALARASADADAVLAFAVQDLGAAPERNEEEGFVIADAPSPPAPSVSVAGDPALSLVACAPTTVDAEGETPEAMSTEALLQDDGEAKPRKRHRMPAAPKIVDTSAAAEVQKVKAVAPEPTQGNAYRFPAFDLMDPGEDQRLVIDETLQARLNENAQQLVTTLNHYGVQGHIREIQPGPTVTTFELEPEAGTKVSKIAGLADDLAMNLGCQVRIVAPIPGKKRVGFEIPNQVRKTVNLRELIEDERFQSMKAPLPVVLGRDIVGKPYYADLASMPHVLVAGATGAGKSVGLNVMLVSLLYRRSPEEMRLLMIDPKVVELQTFDRMPHMLLPVVTDTRQASTALKWAVDEMERRYQLLANAGTKNIKSYNAWVERVLRGEVRGFERPKVSVTTAEDGSIVEVGPEKEPPKLPDKLPYIVIVIDEFADLMMQQGKEVEASIARLAQKARAAGMHVILATQRPSVDVITGMIKANFPTRIAFKVTQRIDSRTILDEQGAEHLLGRGDMLVKMNGTNETKRVQCPFVSEEEVERVTSFLREQGDPEYDDTILQPRDDEAEAGGGDDAEQDPKYDDAVQIVAETRRCSTSWLQRKLGIGYNRAAKIVETMEKRGLVGPAQGAKDREVLIEAP
jgi:S-DNA-T family DNA segregation ATPase FtsK/SpoIIIE